MINKLHIEKFRGFRNIDCDLGSLITVIAGQNGTQKTVLLGMLSQPFAITDKDNPMINERPLCGGNYKSAFQDKFKFSPVFDQPKGHEWTLFVDNEAPFTLESMRRDQRSNALRFWRKGTREKGSGFLQYPVIYLSLKRLFPLGEDEKVAESNKVILTEEEQNEFKKLHKEILISFDNVENSSYIESSNKNTLGVNTDRYDWMLNSAGQDNLGKIILALMSFKRLSKQYPSDYKGGILAIDELDSALYPASQMKLFGVLREYASKYHIQVFFTTHSLSLMREACKIYAECQKRVATSKQVQIIYLEKRNQEVVSTNITSFDTIYNRLCVTLNKTLPKKLTIITEDAEGKDFAQNLLFGKNRKGLQFEKFTIGCSALMDLVKRRISYFCFPQAAIILDGDASKIVDKINWEKLKIKKNIICLPGTTSPERELAKMLYEMDDNDKFWTSINPDYNKQFCFRDISYDEIFSDRVKAKQWYQSQLELWGKTTNKAVRHWSKLHKEEVNGFLKKIATLLEDFKKTFEIE